MHLFAKLQVQMNLYNVFISFEARRVERIVSVCVRVHLRRSVDFRTISFGWS